MTTPRSRRTADDSDLDRSGTEWQTVLRLGHDLNNLLGAIVGYTEMLAEDVPPEAPIAPDLLRVHESAQRAAGVVAELMVHARRARRAESEPG